MTHSPSTDSTLVRQQLSEGFEHLLYQLARHDLRPDADGFHCDVLIIGSGYGGAVAAAQLATQADGRPTDARIWLLERGQAYQPGDFPSQMAELGGHVRFSTPQQAKPKGNRTGLFDIRLGPDLQAVVGNGLGGGSLINAGVMLWPSEEVMHSTMWPQALRDDQAALARWRDHLLVALNAQSASARDSSGACLPKHAGLRRLAQVRSATTVPITVAQSNGLNHQGVAMQACLNCGDCATGCNHGAKASLDTTLLAQARQQGVQLYTGATALYLEQRSHQGWTVWVNHTDAACRAQQDQPVALHARHVVIAAGTFGSTELLLRSRARGGLTTSPLLGERLSGNGDMILSLHKTSAPVQAMADEESAHASRDIGPTITGMIDWRDDPDHPFIVQDLAIPGPLQAFFEEYTAISASLCALDGPDLSLHGAEALDPSAIDPDAMRRTLPLAMIGHDAANGRIELIDSDPDAGDGGVRLVWPDLKKDPRFQAQLDRLDQAWVAPHAQQGTRLFATPGWRPLPPALSRMLDAQPGPMVTVHPLGGCAMAEDSWHGVVNHLGQVFDEDGKVHTTLAVLDGSIMPGSLGVNPALTIATVAQRAAIHLQQQWGLTRSRAAMPEPPEAVALPLQDATRGRFKSPTELQITEQMRGWADEHGIELTLRFKPIQARNLWGGRAHDRVLQVDPRHSFLRIVRPHPDLPKACWESHTELMRAPLSGTLSVFHREASTPTRRRLRGMTAYLWNRGLRDGWLAYREGRQRQIVAASPQEDLLQDLCRRVQQGWDLASHAGQARRMDYTLQIGQVSTPGFEAFSLQPIQGHKRITYALRSNPWRQLMDMTLTQFPATLPARGAVLSLNVDFLAQQSVPLLRITRQASMPDAMLDLTRLALQIARMMGPIHLWSMRKPEAPKPRVICRLPAEVPGLPPPEVTEIDVAPALPDGTPVRVRLTRYRQRATHPHPQGKPLLMLHGYSASGTTFAHPALDPSLALYLWDRGHDIWIADLRTSAGMPTGALPWRFEDVGYVDIPLAVQHVSQATGGGKINVLAHCMGSAMLWMGLLGEPMPDQPPNGLAYQARLDMGKRIHRLAMSQVAPVVVFSPANVLRAYVSQYIQTFLPMGAYRFRADVNDVADGADLAMLDRLLMTIPYPSEDFPIENPPWQMWQDTGWVGTRKRMDALYGQDFKLINISPQFLAYLDDHFGPLSLATMRQGLHLALNQSIANAQGTNVYLNEAKMRHVLDQLDAMMSFHGVDNGLSDIRGLYRFQDFVQRLGPDYGRKYAIHPIAEHGHQDCLVGIHSRERVFPLVERFFQEQA